MSKIIYDGLEIDTVKYIDELEKECLLLRRNRKHIFQLLECISYSEDLKFKIRSNQQIIECPTFSSVIQRMIWSKKDFNKQEERLRKMYESDSPGEK